ncbi:hypothetical protein [Desulforapulum autotrophicum]|uniref:hypothetical protein n=1 Tax=Desulforapulum autotrophicum TaxID=2296 RepID=UPI0002FA111F|nr:hypothetical protein [Desulforapulum autotrophicum]
MDKADRPNRMRTMKDLRSLLEGIPDGVRISEKQTRAWGDGGTVTLRMVRNGSVMVGWVPDGGR